MKCTRVIRHITHWSIARLTTAQGCTEDLANFRGTFSNPEGCSFCQCLLALYICPFEQYWTSLVTQVGSGVICFASMFKIYESPCTKYINILPSITFWCWIRLKLSMISTSHDLLFPSQIYFLYWQIVQWLFDATTKSLYICFVLEFHQSAFPMWSTLLPVR